MLKKEDSIGFPTADKAQFEAAIKHAIATFPENRFLQRVKNNEVTVAHYHQLLKIVFHQTFHAPALFALAGAMCDPHRIELRDYLIHHADEEKTHWQWALDDLRNTGYKGTDPRKEFPSEATQSFVAFNFYLSMRVPLARLGTAAMLESLGGKHGKRYATDLFRALKLTENQVTFFMRHGETDVGHAEEVLEIIEKSRPTPEEWGWLCHAANTAFKLYQRMFDEAGA